MPSSEYDRKQADTLTLLANSTSNRAKALVLLKMADDHVKHAEEAETRVKWGGFIRAAALE